MTKRLVLALGLVLLVGLTGTALDKADYRVYFTTESGTVIAGITNTGRLDTLLGSLALDDIDTTFGTSSDVSIEYSTADANANSLLIQVPTGGAINVPGVVIAQADSDWADFNGVTETFLALQDAAGTSWARLDFSAATAARLSSGGSAASLTIATLAAGADIVLDAMDAAAGTSQTYVSITGTTPVHASGTPTDIFLDITPSITANTATATWNLIDLTFSSPVWATGAATSTLRGVYFAPTIGNASAGTNTVALLDVAAITGDASVSLYGLRLGALTGTGATENAIDIGSGWDNGINTASGIDCQASITLANDEAIANAGDGVVTLTSDDATGAQVTIIGADGDGTSDAVLLLDADAGGDNADSWFIKSVANGNNFSLTNHATEVLTLTTAGLLQIDSDIKVDGGDINNTTAGVGIDIEPTMAAAGSNSVVLALTGTQATHASGTPTDIFLDFNPTFGINTVSTTVNLVDLTFSSPAWATGGATSVLRGLYFAPTIGNASAGTNTVALIDVAAITGDASVSLYGMRLGALTGTGATEYAFSIGAGWDAEFALGNGATIANGAADDLTITEVNIILEGITKTNTLTIDDGSEDVKIDSDNQTATLPTITIPDFTDATADFLVTNTFTTTLPFAGGLRGEDTDGAGTNGGGLIGGAPDITTNKYAAAAGTVFVKVYDAGTTTWDDLSTSALLTAGADWAANYQLLPDADAEAENDAFAVGFATKFCELVFDDLATAAGTVATWGGDGGKWQYSTGAGTWSDLTVFDNSDSTAYDGLRSLQRAGAITFVPPANWVSATYDGQAGYWVKYVITAAQLTQTPLIDGTNHDEPMVAIPNGDTFSSPFKLEITKVRVTNMHATVHDQNIVFVVANFTDGVYSAAQTWTGSQLSDKFTLASAIAADAGDLIGICVTNDTASTNNPIWAVEFEVTYED